MDIAVFFILMFLILPVFLVCRWLSKKFIKVERARKMVTWVSTLIVAPLVYIGAVFIWIFCISYYPKHTFSRERWVNNQEQRYELSHDMINSKMLLGKTKTQVRQLLGDSGEADESDEWYYYLGYRPQLFNIDPDVLDIEFKNGVVIRVSQHTT